MIHSPVRKRKIHPPARKKDMSIPCLRQTQSLELQVVGDSIDHDDSELAAAEQMTIPPDLG
jgi:hypothetical protein